MILDVNNYAEFSCGGVSGFPAPVANIVAMVINVLKIAVPIIIIVLGMIDLFKAVTKQKDDEMKKRIAFSHKAFFSYEQRRTPDVF